MTAPDMNTQVRCVICKIPMIMNAKEVLEKQGIVLCNACESNDVPISYVGHLLAYAHELERQFVRDRVEQTYDKDAAEAILERFRVSYAHDMLHDDLENFTYGDE